MNEEIMECMRAMFHQIKDINKDTQITQRTKYNYIVEN